MHKIFFNDKKKSNEENKIEHKNLQLIEAT